MAERPLLCTRCHSPATIAEDVQGYLDWGPAVIDSKGVVRPADPDYKPVSVMGDNGRTVGRPRACCTNRDCGHQWRLRRLFDPIEDPS